MNSEEEYDRIAGIVNVLAFEGVEAVCQLLRRNVICLDAEVQNGETPLGIAVRYSNDEVAEYLINTCKVNVDRCFPDKGGEPPIKIAYDQGDTKMFDMLLQAGADIHLPGWMGVSVFDRMHREGGELKNDATSQPIAFKGKGVRAEWEWGQGSNLDKTLL